MQTYFSGPQTFGGIYSLTHSDLSPNPYCFNLTLLAAHLFIYLHVFIQLLTNAPSVVNWSNSRQKHIGAVKYVMIRGGLKCKILKHQWSTTDNRQYFSVKLLIK